MTTTPTSGAADLPAMVSKAMREAYNLGQRYWQQADSEYISQHKKADDTRAKFLALVEETCAALAAGQATAAPAQPAPSGATEEVENLRKALVYAAFALHDTPQYMLAQGITLIDGDTVRVSRDGWTVEASVNPHRQPAPATQPIDPISELNLQIVD